MLICPTCGWKNPRRDFFDKHMLKHTPVPEEMKLPVEPVDVPVTEPIDVPVVETPVVEPVPMPLLSHDIVLKFTKPVEIYINGHEYLGKEITVKDMSLAAEIVRIARDAYGVGIMV